MPLPGSRVVPDGWEAHHRPVPEGAMTATVTISLPDVAGTWDDATSRTVYGPGTLLWSGAARVQALPVEATTPVVGEQQQTVRRYQVSVPLGCPAVPVGAALDVTTATDQQAEALALRVVDNPDGSLLWERDLVCEQREPQN